MSRFVMMSQTVTPREPGIKSPGTPESLVIREESTEYMTQKSQTRKMIQKESTGNESRKMTRREKGIKGGVFSSEV
jgi:hypothetical protein